MVHPSTSALEHATDCSELNLTSRDDFSTPTKRYLSMRAAYICSRPDCRTLTLSPSPTKPDDYVMIGVAAHITAAAQGGPRYDGTLTTEQRKDIENGIFLCESCAKLIDKNRGQDHSPESLREWKTAHEQWVGDNLNRSQENIAAQVSARVLEKSRGGALRSLLRELSVNRQVLNDDKFKPGTATGEYTVFPRVMLAITNIVLASGSFSHGDDEQFLKLLFEWLEMGAEFNRRLEITEQFGQRVSMQEIMEWHKKLVHGNVIETTKTTFEKLSTLLLDRYAGESGVDSQTVLFGEP
jgi:hypothetical protein